MTHKITKSDFNGRYETIITFSSEDNKTLVLETTISKNGIITEFVITYDDNKIKRFLVDKGIGKAKKFYNKIGEDTSNE